ncbi:hypothetical protein BV20DRAFT_669832 [Pilatotrama ljubarskyi]|nr:hypothetical protein BV20DRAFT_669832 [Pilatotrama ljubarskyi]
MKAIKRLFSSSRGQSKPAAAYCRHPACRKSFKPRDAFDQFCSRACLQDYNSRPSRTRRHIPTTHPPPQPAPSRHVSRSNWGTGPGRTPQRQAECLSPLNPQYYLQHPGTAIATPHGSYSSPQPIHPTPVSHTTPSSAWHSPQAGGASTWAAHTPQARYASPYSNASSSRPPPANPSYYKSDSRPPPANPSRFTPAPQRSPTPHHPFPSSHAMERGPSAPAQPRTQHRSGLRTLPERPSSAGHTPGVALIPLFADPASDWHLRPPRTPTVSSTSSGGDEERHGGFYDADGRPVLARGRYEDDDTPAARWPTTDWKTASSATLVPTATGAGHRRESRATGQSVRGYCQAEEPATTASRLRASPRRTPRPRSNSFGGFQFPEASSELGGLELFA